LDKETRLQNITISRVDELPDIFSSSSKESK
jgi:hypothetical protein